VRRIAPVIIATVAGLGVLAAFKTSPATPNRPLAFARTGTRTPASGVAPPRATPTTPTTATTPRTPVTGAGSQGSASPTTAPTTVPARRTFVGDDFPNQYGDVQVQVVVQGHQVVDVQALQLPSSHQRSQEISQQAEPILRREALQAQTAQIDLLSGATFTSESYAESLQSALDRAGI
jgi:hypothetical protein